MIYCISCIALFMVISFFCGFALRLGSIFIARVLQGMTERR